MAQDYPECSGFGRRREADGSQTRRWSKGVRKDRRRLPAEPGAAVRPLHSARGIPFGRATGTRPPPVFCGWHEPPLTHRLTMRAVQSLEPARRKVRHAEAEGVGPSSRRGTGSGRWVDPPGTFGRRADASSRVCWCIRGGPRQPRWGHSGRYYPTLLSKNTQEFG